MGKVNVHYKLTSRGTGGFGALTLEEEFLEGDGFLPVVSKTVGFGCASPGAASGQYQGQKQAYNANSCIQIICLVSSSR